MNTAQDIAVNPTAQVEPSSSANLPHAPIVVIDEHHLQQEHYENDNHTVALQPKKHDTWIRLPKHIPERDKKILCCFVATVLPIYLVAVLIVAIIMIPILLLCAIPSPYTAILGLGGLLAVFLFLLALCLANCLFHMITSIITALVYCCMQYQRNKQLHMQHHEEHQV